MAMVVLVVTVVAVNIWWVLANRRGYPFDIDEAGYLIRALVDADVLRSGGITALAAHVHGPDPQAPLLPVTAGVVHAATGVGPVGMMVTQQLFVAILLVSTYSIGRRLGSRAQALVATALVAACPGVVDASRSFGFGLVAMAMVTAALAVQLWAGSFDRWPRALAWGVVLGLAALARTMVLGILPGLVLAAGMVVSAPGRRARRWATLAGSLVIAFAVAWSWYSASWRNVEQYLASYGYGSAARAYGHALPPWALGWWTTRPAALVDKALLLPVVLAVATCLVSGVAVRACRTASAGAGSGPGLEGQSRARHVLAWLRGDRGTVAVVVVWSYLALLALSSTDNVGSGFVLVLVPLVILLSVSFFACALHGHRRALLAALVVLGVVAVGSFAADSWPVTTSGPVTVAVAGWRVTVVDDEGTLRSVVTSDASERLPTASVDRELRAEGAAVGAVATLVEAAEPPGSPPPTVALATSDQFVNVNSIGLDVLERTGVSPDMALLHSPGGGAPSIASQLTGPDAPGVVVVGPNTPGARLVSYRSMDDPLVVVPLLPPAGFRRVGVVRLPDGRTLQVWSRSAATP
jgi:hypothetical protein